MTPAEMQPDIPYIVTRGSAALGLVRGDRVECRTDGALLNGKGGFYRDGWRQYQLSVDVDRGGIMERIAQLESQINTLKEMLE